MENPKVVWPHDELPTGRSGDVRSTEMFLDPDERDNVAKRPCRKELLGPFRRAPVQGVQVGPSPCDRSGNGRLVSYSSRFTDHIHFTRRQA